MEEMRQQNLHPLFLHVLDPYYLICRTPVRNLADLPQTDADGTCSSEIGPPSGRGRPPVDARSLDLVPVRDHSSASPSQ